MNAHIESSCNCETSWLCHWDGRKFTSISEALRKELVKWKNGDL